MDVLTMDQKRSLAAAALNYIADSEEKGTQIARSLGYLENDGHPISVCGPLSAAILRDAGLISPYVVLHDFWLLNPRQNPAILEQTFPPEDFNWFQTDQSIASFDFASFPLRAGDFIYLFAGERGSFEHMLVVSRVDEAGRAYAVTNINTTEGTLIQEVLLVDPGKPNIGQFAVWTDRKNSSLGLTGFGGFLLIRFRTPVPEKTAPEQWFSRKLDKLLETTGGLWRILIKEVDRKEDRGRVIYARHERQTTHPASVIKVPIAMLFLKSLEKAGVQNYSEALSKGIDGRSYRQLLEAMLVKSEEKATDSLEKAILESNLDVQATLQAWGAQHTFIDIRQSTAREIAILFEGLYNGNLLKAISRQIILTHMAAYTPGDDLRLGTLRKYLPPGYPFYNKRGTITDDLLVVADAAIVRIPQKQGDMDYIIAAFGYQGEKPTTAAKLEAALGEISTLFWQFTRKL
jgi:beta-lactamase class A